MRLLVKGQPSPPFSLFIDKKNDLDSVKRDPAVAREIRELSRLKYGTPVEEVEEFINRRLQEDTLPDLPPETSPFSKLPF